MTNSLSAGPESRQSGPAGVDKRPALGFASGPFPF
jgi:hypothetical protein